MAVPGQQAFNSLLTSAALSIASTAVKRGYQAAFGTSTMPKMRRYNNGTFKTYRQAKSGRYYKPNRRGNISKQFKRNYSISRASDIKLRVYLNRDKLIKETVVTGKPTVVQFTWKDLFDAAPVINNFHRIKIKRYGAKFSSGYMPADGQPPKLYWNLNSDQQSINVASLNAYLKNADDVAIKYIAYKDPIFVNMSKTLRINNHEPAGSTKIVPTPVTNKWLVPNILADNTLTHDVFNYYLVIKDSAASAKVYFEDYLDIELKGFRTLTRVAL